MNRSIYYFVFLGLFATSFLPAYSLAQEFEMDSSFDGRPVRANVEVRTRVENGSPSQEARARVEMMKRELEEKRAETDARIEARRLEAERRRVEAESRRSEFRQDVAKRQVENAARVTLLVIERLENIIQRLESRIEKVKISGGATAESERFVVAAKADISSARALVTAFSNLDLSGSNAQEVFERIRESVAGAREHIRSAHRNLMMAVRSLRMIEVESEEGSDD